MYKNRQKKYVVIKSDDGGHRIKQSDIWYFEIVKRKLLIHLAEDQVLSIWKSVKEFRKQIADEDFVKINSGCVVNMKYIKDYTNKDVTLDNGKKLFTSRAGLKVVKEKLATYMGERI